MDYCRAKELIDLAKTDGVKVCAWGAGYVGTHYGYELTKELGIKIDFYCDNNENLYGKEIRDGIICVDKNCLPRDVVCIILTSGHLFADIANQLMKMGITNIIHYMDLCEYQAKGFFDFQKRKQIAVYTCIVGAYDEVLEPEIIEDECDYYLISDRKPERDTIYQFININNFIGSGIIDNTRKNRYCKINAHEIFPQYRYSIYIDGNILLKGRMTQYVHELPKTRIMALTKMSYRSIYAEALRCMMHGRDDKENFLKQVERYWLEGMPEDFGVVAPAIMVREHNNPVCYKLMSEWWNEISNYSKRDMISLPYVLWKNGYVIDDVRTLSKDLDVIDGNEWTVERNHGKSRIAEER